MFSNGIVVRPAHLVYFFIPKAACSSLKKVFADFLQLPIHQNSYNVHAVNFETIQPAAMGNFQEYQAIAVVRNPYSRLWSLYSNKIKASRSIKNLYVRNGVESAVFSKYGQKFYGGMTFAQFVDAIVSVPYASADPHFCPQHLQLQYIEPMVFKMEAIKTLEQYLNAKGVAGKLPHRNKWSRGDWREQYTPEIAAKVNAYYKEDFQKYGYDIID